MESMKRSSLVLLIAFTLLGTLAKHILAQDAHIFFTGSLNDKQEGCTCSKNPAPGIARRAAIVSKLQKRYPRSIWIDTGDNVFGTYSRLQWRLMAKYWGLSPYHALVLGDQEWETLLITKSLQQKYFLIQ